MLNFFLKMHKIWKTKIFNSSVPEGKLMGVELIGVYKSGSINWGYRRPLANAFFVAAQNPRYAKFALRES